MSIGFYEMLFSPSDKRGYHLVIVRNGGIATFRDNFFVAKSKVMGAAARNYGAGQKRIRKG